MSDRHKGNLRGLCGNWNDLTNDDTCDANGIQDLTGFADTWRTDLNCPEVPPKLQNFDPCKESCVSML